MSAAVVLVRRVEEDDIARGLRRRGPGRAARRGRRPRTTRARSAPGAVRAQVGRDRPGRAARPARRTWRGPRPATGPRSRRRRCRRTGPGTWRPRRSGSRIGEQRLLDPVAEGSRPLPRGLQPDAAGRPGDDPAGVSHGAVTCRVAGSAATRWRSQPRSSSAASDRLGAGPSGPSASSSASACDARPDGKARGAPGPGATRRAAAASRSGRGPSTSPSRRSSKSLLGQLEPIGVSATALSRARAISSVGVRHEDAERLRPCRGRRGRAAGGAGPARTGRRPGRPSSSRPGRRRRPRPRSCRRARPGRRPGTAPSRHRGRPA